MDPLITYAELSRRISKAMFDDGREWAGLPMPLPGLGLVIEDRHPGAQMIADAQAAIDIDSDRPRERTVDSDGWHLVNEWRGRTPGGVTGRMFILRHEDGRTTWGCDPDTMRRNTMLFGPLETFDAWHLETELTAIDRLAELVTERQFRAYVLTGSFLERSTRSEVAYLFRRCRPTVAISGRAGIRHKLNVDAAAPDSDEGKGIRILACLCLHPIAYYARTFAGAMVPTDDVIAHLMLMRGDEAMFWRRANQHHPLDPESGL